MPAPDMTVLEALAEPTRLRILDRVRDAEQSVTELVDSLGVVQPTVSRHLRVLREAGLVSVRKDAQRRVYRLRAQPLMELDAWLEPYRAHWAGRLDALEQHLSRTARQRGTSPAPPDSSTDPDHPTRGSTAPASPDGGTPDRQEHRDHEP